MNDMRWLIWLIHRWLLQRIERLLLGRIKRRLLQVIWRLLLQLIHRCLLRVRRSHLYTLIEGFFRGPNDHFVLTIYADHVALRLWKGELYMCYVELVFIYYWYVENNWCFLLCLLQDRLPLKVSTHGEKLKFLNVLIPTDAREIWMIVISFHWWIVHRRCLTVHYCQHLLSDGIRWHLPFGEMTITLDDLSSLFHLPLTGSFFIAPLIREEIACITTIYDLRVTKEQVRDKFKANKGATFAYLGFGIGMQSWYNSLCMRHPLGYTCYILKDILSQWISLMYISMWGTCDCLVTLTI